MGSFQVSLVPVAAAVIWSFAFGMFWYAPKVLGNLWMKELDVTQSSNMKKSFFLEFAASLAGSYILTLLITWFASENLQQALTLSFLVWAGFNFRVFLSRMAWENTSCKGIMVNIFGSLIAILGSATVIFFLI